MYMKLIEAGEYLFLFFTYSGYILFFLAFTGIWKSAPLYLEEVNNYYKIVVSLVLLYIFNPYLKTEIKPVHERMAFNAGLYLLLSSNLLLLFNRVVKTTQMGHEILQVGTKDIIESGAKFIKIN